MRARGNKGAYPRMSEPTAADVHETMAPIKAFMTRRGTGAGMTLPTLDLPAAPREPAAVTPQIAPPAGRHRSA
jgi:hypothetical protein